MKKVFIVLISIIPILASGQQSDTVDLIQCFRLAVSNHPLYQQKDLNNDISRAKKANYSKAWLPSVNLEGQATYQSDAISIDMVVPDISTQPPTFIHRSIESDPDQYKIYLNIQQSLYDGGVIKQRKSYENTSLLANQQQLEIEFYKTKQQVSSVFFAISALSKNIELFQNMKSELQERYNSTKVAVDNGVIIPSNLQVLQAEILKIDQQCEELENKRFAQLRILSKLTGIALNGNTCLRWPEDIKITDSIGQRPELLLFEYQKETVENGLSIEKSARRPGLFAYSQAGYGKPGLNMLNDKFDTYYTVGLGLKWNIYDWGTMHNKKKIAGYQKETIGLQQNNLNLGISVAAENELANIENYGSAIEKDMKILELREEIVKTSLIQFNNGTITATQYFTEVNAELQAKIQYEMHRIMLAQSLINYQLIKGDILL